MKINVTNGKTIATAALALLLAGGMSVTAVHADGHGDKEKMMDKADKRGSEEGKGEMKDAADKRGSEEGKGEMKDAADKRGSEEGKEKMKDGAESRGSE